MTTKKIKGKSTESQDSGPPFVQPASNPALVEPAPEPGFPIVGIGASAGGLAAFEAFFSAMPANSEPGPAFVLVQHLSPDHDSNLSDLIKHYARMPVYKVENGMTVQPNCVYIIPPNCDMALVDGTLQLLEPAAPRGLRLPIDFFFHSLAEQQRNRAICIVLSGTGSDGTLGVRAIKGEGGMVMAQDPDTTEYDGMPRSAIATGQVDYVLPPAELPAQLMAYIAHTFAAKPGPKTDDILAKICVLLRAQTGHDFSQYKTNTLLRRIERRMALHQFEQPDDYLRYVQKTPAEVEALFRDMLIGVTSFFRDPEAFAALQTQVIPRLLARKSVGETVRVWVCGCSTGEEAYSIAILFQEHLETLKNTFKVQIFATDIDRQAIEYARSGVFSASIAADISPDRLARYFDYDPAGDVYRVHRYIRDLLIFSEQNVIKDPPFFKLDLVSCRNLLIYLNGDLQKKLIPLFHYALNPSGVLFLGTSETIGEYLTFFAALDRKWRLYLRLDDAPGAARPPLGEIAFSLTESRAVARRGVADDRNEGRINFRELTEQTLLQHYVSVGVLVNGRGEILYIYGRTGKYLEPAPGDAGMNILDMAREGLRRELTVALRKAVTHREPVYYPGVRVKTNGDFSIVNLTVQPVAGKTPPSLFLIILEEALPLAGSALAPSIDIDERVAAFEQELQAREEYLQIALEEMETSNEELKSANEEMQSVNEELQSTNEELETSKTELQSVNEELRQAQELLELQRTRYFDLYDLAPVGYVTLNEQGLILEANRTAAAMLETTKDELARQPLAQFILLEDHDIYFLHRNQLFATGQPQICELRLVRPGGAPFWVRLEAVLTQNRENGATVCRAVMSDITVRKQVEMTLRETNEKFSIALEVGGAGVWEWNVKTNNVRFDDNFHKMLGYAPGELPTKLEPWLAYHNPDDIPVMMGRVEAYWRGDTPIYESEHRLKTKTGEWNWIFTRGKIIKWDQAGQPEWFIGIVTNITERKQIEATLQQTEAQRSNALRLAKLGHWEYDIAQDLFTFNDEFYAIFRTTAEQVGGYTMSSARYAELFVHPDDAPLVATEVENSITTTDSNYSRQIEHRIIYADGESGYITVQFIIIKDSQGQTIKTLGVNQDITERKQAEEKLQHTLQEKELLLRELYHRTKNNMMVISSLLSLQADHAANPELSGILRELQNKIRTMALVHQKLYQSQNLSNIDLGDYIPELVTLLLRSHQVTPADIALVLQLESVSVLIDTAIPCGLVLNELMTNALKHGFPHNRKGEIKITLARTAAGKIALTFADNGVGVPAGFDFRAQATLGLQTIFMIVEHQLQGTIQFETGQGITCKILFESVGYLARV